MDKIMLTSEEKSQLQEWICQKRKGKFTLLYKLSRDGWNATTFHTKCDHKGPTVTVLYNTEYTVFGGYTSQSWTSPGNGFYGTDPKAFLFQLRYRGSESHRYYQCTGNGSKAIYCVYNQGPTFGSGPDFLPFTGNSNQFNTKVYKLNGRCNLDNSYQYPENVADFNDGHMNALDLEVYQFEDGSEFDIMETPWREFPEWDTKTLEKLKDEVENYRPVEETNIPKANILLIGKIGAGKSSFINTINSILRGNITSPAITGISDHSLTTSLRIYQVRSQLSRKPLNFNLYDTRGLEEDQGIDSQELCYILDGNLPDKYTFNPSCQATPAVPGFNKNPGMRDMIHVVAFVVDASSFEDMSDDLIAKIKNLRSKMNQRDIPQVVLLTNVDQISEIVEKNLSKLFHCKAIQEHVDDVAKLIGLPRGHVMPLKNYECEMDLHQNVTILSLHALSVILRFADDFLMNNIEPSIEANQEGDKNKKSSFD